MSGGGCFLGTHQPGWLGRLDVPLLVSHRTQRTRWRARGRVTRQHPPTAAVRFDRPAITARRPSPRDDLAGRWSP